ncbi:Hint domain-containing protein [Yoonia maritima]|uniref:Hint domain-containing protein n=1 Tax=Yoonia maritima TaxID=1435347 RepID=UPI001EF75B7B|nr:Hint domain-containing protein [Yoonia maritima]
MNTGLGGPAGYGENVFSTSGLTAGNVDDGSILVDVTSVFGATGIDYYGTDYTGIYINSNGLITFEGPETSYQPSGISNYTDPAIAPFWSDVDLNKGGEIYWDLDPANGTVTVTWDGVAPFSGTGSNSFQMILSDTGGGNFSVEFIYDNIEWTEGYSGAGPATVGFTDGGSNLTTLPGSGDATALTQFDTTDFGNGDPDGTWESDVVGGVTLSSDGVVSGTSGDDVIDAAYDGDIDNDFVDGADGTGTNRNDDVISAGAGNDTISAGEGDDSVFGGSGDDIIDGGLGADTLRGEDGDDTITVAQGDTATGGDGDDTFLVTDLGEPGISTITITGGEGNETDGDTLNFQDLIGFGDVTYTNTDDAAGGLSGFATLADGTVVNFSEIENVIICFTAGTRIATPYGQRPIETLDIGDTVLTKGNGPRPIRWIGKRTVPAIGKLAPIRIKAGVFANTRDLLVSPQHRMIYDGWKTQINFNQDEVLIAAKHLVNDDTVVRETADEVTYIHIMFDQHEIVFAENAASESFFPGTSGLDAVEHAAREELFSIFPELRSMPTTFGPTARMCLRQFEAQLLNAT